MPVSSGRSRRGARHPRATSTWRSPRGSPSIRSADWSCTTRSRTLRDDPSGLVGRQRAGTFVLTQALTGGKRIVKRDSGVLARLLVKMWYLNDDLMPLVRMIQDTRRERFLHGQ